MRRMSSRDCSFSSCLLGGRPNQLHAMPLHHSHAIALHFLGLSQIFEISEQVLRRRMSSRDCSFSSFFGLSQIFEISEQVLHLITVPMSRRWGEWEAEIAHSPPKNLFRNVKNLAKSEKMRRMSNFFAHSPHFMQSPFIFGNLAKFSVIFRFWL